MSKIKLFEDGDLSCKMFERNQILYIFFTYTIEAIYRDFIDVENRIAKVGNGGLSRMVLFLQTGSMYRRLVGRADNVDNVEFCYRRRTSKDLTSYGK